MTGIKSSSKPIELLPTNLARIFNLAHPCLLLSAYYAQLPLLISNPLRALIQFLLPLAAIQTTYVVLCFASVRSSSFTQIRRVKASRKKNAVDVATHFSTVFFALILAGLSVPPLTALQILFGAPFTSHLSHTILSSAHLSLLAIFPLIYVHGIDGLKWREIVSVSCPLDGVFGASIGTFVGGWLGAIPIPLDWDREWQKWPITVVTGMYIGCVFGNVIGGWILKGKRIEMD